MAIKPRLTEKEKTLIKQSAQIQIASLQRLMLNPELIIKELLAEGKFKPGEITIEHAEEDLKERMAVYDRIIADPSHLFELDEKEQGFIEYILIEYFFEDEEILDKEDIVNLWKLIIKQEVLTDMTDTKLNLN